MHALSVFTQSLGYALIHSLWQGGIVALLLRLTPKAAAQVRYQLAYVSLLTIVAWFLWTFWQYAHQLQNAVVRVAVSNLGDEAYQVGNVSTTPHSAWSVTSGWLQHLEQWFPVLACIYVAGLLVLTARMIISLRSLHLLRTRYIEEPNRNVTQLCLQLAAEQGIFREIQVLLSRKINTPLMFGLIKPVILLPVHLATSLSEEQLKAILLHELAHIRRHDFLLNLIQTVIETLLFFNPAVWIIGRIIRSEREHCCDDLVVQQSGVALPYAQALAAIAAYQASEATFSLAATGHKYTLFHRIKRIMETKTQKLSPVQASSVLTLIAFVTLSVILFSPAIAQKQKGNSGSETAQDDKGKHGTAHVVKTKDTNHVTVRFSHIDTSGNTATFTLLGKKDTIDFITDEAGELTINGKAVPLKEMIYSALDSVDWNKISTDIKVAMSEVDKARKEAKITITKTDVREINQDVKRAMADLNLSTEDIATIMNAVKTSLEEAATGIHEASKEIINNTSVVSVSGTKVNVSSSGINRMIDEMESDGLINKEKGYIIRKKENQLSVNGKKQPEEVYNRYKKYFQAKSIFVSGKKDDMSISIKN